jgi:hypothetical protein
MSGGTLASVPSARMTNTKPEVCGFFQILKPKASIGEQRARERGDGNRRYRSRLSDSSRRDAIIEISSLVTGEFVCRDVWDRVERTKFYGIF